MSKFCIKLFAIILIIGLFKANYSLSRSVDEAQSYLSMLESELSLAAQRNIILGVLSSKDEEKDSKKEELDSSLNNSLNKSQSGGLLDQIRQGVSLRKVSEQEKQSEDKAVSSDNELSKSNDFLEQIRQGVQLKSVPKEEKESSLSSDPIARALQERLKKINISNFGDNEDDSDDSDDEWDD